MTKEVETLAQHETIDLATTIITLGRIRHLPVTDSQNRVRGLVTHRDVLEAIAEMYRDQGATADPSKLEVGRMMTRDVATVSPDASLGEAAALMYERKFGCLPVVEDGELVGILTEADFVADAIDR
jgi:CBS domain-containing membrane protein